MRSALATTPAIVVLCTTCCGPGRHSCAEPTSIDRLARVLILLPPSETKTPPTTGDPLQLDSLDLPELAPARESCSGR